MAVAPKRSIRTYRPTTPTALAALAPGAQLMDRQAPGGQPKERALNDRGGTSIRTITFATDYVPLTGGRPSTALPYAAIRPVRKCGKSVRSMAGEPAACVRPASWGSGSAAQRVTTKRGTSGGSMWPPGGPCTAWHMGSLPATAAGPSRKAHITAAPSATTRASRRGNTAGGPTTLGGPQPQTTTTPLPRPADWCR